MRYLVLPPNQVNHRNPRNDKVVLEPTVQLGKGLKLTIEYFKNFI